MKVREHELLKVVSKLTPGSSILELGAGAGWQAKRLSELGFNVTAIDIPQSNYADIREWEVIEFDGSHIPFPDGSFDVVFSSNVLEHIPHVASFQKEIMRILKEDGKAVHVMPSAVWRTATILTFYPDRVKKAFRKLLPQKSSTRSEITRAHDYSPKSKLQKVLQKVLPPRHGETGTFLSELYLFSAIRWSKLFKASGWNLTEVEPAGLFYSGQRIFGSSLSIATRGKLARILGSSCTIYTMKKK